MGDVIHEKGELIVNTPEKFKALTGVEVLTLTEATAVHPDAKTVDARNLETGETASYNYDKLVIATGASPFVPEILGSGTQKCVRHADPDDAIALPRQ